MSSKIAIYWPRYLTNACISMHCSMLEQTKGGVGGLWVAPLRAGLFRDKACLVAVAGLSDTISGFSGRNFDLCVDYTCDCELALRAAGDLAAETLESSFC